MNPLINGESISIQPIEDILLYICPLALQCFKYKMSGRSSKWIWDYGPIQHFLRTPHNSFTKKNQVFIKLSKLLKLIKLMTKKEKKTQKEEIQRKLF